MHRYLFLSSFFVRSRSFLVKSFFILAIVVSVFFFIKQELVQALSRNFSQTDWSGGLDTVSTIDDNSLSNWTKYYSKTDGIKTSDIGEMKLNIDISQP